ncbi:MAG: putative ubiquinone biosynthesis protein UbiB [Candidatus Accumulibacter sp. BA-94]|uniref:ABC1 kinase family protein n=1 Tax=Accumulibacter sp. TaxID=2053492 RepID=UPI00044812BF|nr:AarF/ABC1/UbiB kinase family protein [Accumulibacter sp.]EXI81311.1 MAG: putative ubiquinone biosynthesis protein UbiB [Candidatus Accumulibacter sp. BA-94]MBL8392044.1 AarF/ABC1/UbiB kinase family protein [Accumulibacter sp.]HRD89182.1 AarF/ABC1/UbiB kinase family protein [Accumulibacter sp.]
MVGDERSRRDAGTSAVPGGRWSRFARLGALAGGVAGSMLAEGTRQFAQGKRPRVGDLLLTPANVRRVADQLAQLRGAAMKLGQLLSMDAGDLFPPELAAILARLRADARAMPPSQLSSVLDAQWGHGWERHFRQFASTPVAAASIGQVHLAQTKDGRRLAIKVQYPGVRQSIDSDVDNVATLLRISGLLPHGLDVGMLLHETKRQLHAEADYLGEGAWLRRYAGLVADAPEFMLPEVHADLTTESVLAMSCMGGEPVESLLDAPQAERDRVAGLLFALLFREIFEFRLIQTDPNFANYRYDTATRQLILLDFGATRRYPAAIVDAYRRLMASAVAGDRQEMSVAASAIGYFRADIGERQRQLVLDVFLQACEPLRHAGAYDFGHSDLPARIRDAGLALSTERDSWHTPPADALFLHRKAGGLYLLAAKLKARVDIRALFLPYALRQVPS